MKEYIHKVLRSTEVGVVGGAPRAFGGQGRIYKVTRMMLKQSLRGQRS